MQVIVMDELGDGKDVAAAQTISQRGVSLVATAHAISLQSLIQNPALNPLLGVIRNVILGDAQAKCAHQNHAGLMLCQPKPTIRVFAEQLQQQNSSRARTITLPNHFATCSAFIMCAFGSHGLACP